MTNREWGESLSDEELARNIAQHVMCDNCPMFEKCYSSPSSNCQELFLE